MEAAVSKGMAGVRMRTARSRWSGESAGGRNGSYMPASAHPERTRRCTLSGSVFRELRAELKPTRPYGRRLAVSSFRGEPPRVLAVLLSTAQNRSGSLGQCRQLRYRIAHCFKSVGGIHVPLRRAFAAD